MDKLLHKIFMSCCHIIVWQKCEDSVMRLASTQGTQPAVSILEGNHINFGWTVCLVRIKKSPCSWLQKPEARFKTCKKKFFFSGSSVCIWKSEKPLKGGRTLMKTDKTSSLFTHKSPHTMVEVSSSNMEIRKCWTPSSYLTDQLISWHKKATKENLWTRTLKP